MAGNGEEGFSGDGGPATDASLDLGFFGGGLAVDAAGNLYIADSGNKRLRKVSPDGIITTVAGNGGSGFSGDGGPATSASLGFPGGVAVDASGNLHIARQFSTRIRKISPDGIITTVAGGKSGFSGDGGGRDRKPLHRRRRSPARPEGFTHCDTGQMLAEHWRLPEEISHVIFYHHDVQQAKLYPVLVALVSSSNLFCHTRGLGYGPYEARQVDFLDEPAWLILTEEYPYLRRFDLARFTFEVDEFTAEVRNLVDSLFHSS